MTRLGRRGHGAIKGPFVAGVDGLAQPHRHQGVLQRAPGTAAVEDAVGEVARLVEERAALGREVQRRFVGISVREELERLGLVRLLRAGSCA